ncbi:LPS export ABC transporter ATP-binding protein [Devosia sp. BK]|uniref:LPS export ABC transporter ATP-binding protein n=2 Tax=Devosia TaxID=46913 RepID=UPI003977531A
MGGQSRNQCLDLYRQAGWPGDRGLHLAMSQTRLDQSGWLVAQGLAKSFGKRAVVRDVSLAVRRGEAVGLLGPNGAGKTTVFTMIMGLVRPDAGKIQLDGNDITHLPLFQRGQLGIGYLPQEPSIFRGMTVEGNILAILENTVRGRAERKQRLRQLLDEFSISHLAKSNALSLSGGERRRVEIARALAAEPIFMLLDEPFAGVDPIAVAEVKGLVRQLTQRGIGVLITDHAVRETLGLVDRAYVIHGGSVMIQGKPETISADPDARRVYLGENFQF